MQDNNKFNCLSIAKRKRNSQNTFNFRMFNGMNTKQINTQTTIP